MAFTWDEESGRYRHGRSGRFLSRGQARALYDRYTDGVSDAMADVSARLAEGRISLADWEREMRRQIRDAHATAHAMARGGWKRMTPSDWGRVGAAVREQYKYLSAFAAGIETGAVPRTKALAARARLYAEAARRSHFETERWLMANRGYVEERSVLGIADHCDGCLAEAGKGWRPIGTLLPIGGRDCKARCRCWFEYRSPAEIAAGPAKNDGSLPKTVPIPDHLISTKPRLPVLREGAEHLDLNPETTIEEFRRTVARFDREVLAIFDENGRLTHAPIVGVADEVEVESFGRALQGRYVAHNHPSGAPFSFDDLAVMAARNLRGMEAIGPERVFVALKPAEGWPNMSDVKRDWNTAKQRALKTGHDLRGKYRVQARELQKLLANKERHGDRAIIIAVEATAMNDKSLYMMQVEDYYGLDLTVEQSMAACDLIDQNHTDPAIVACEKAFRQLGLIPDVAPAR